MATIRFINAVSILLVLLCNPAVLLAAGTYSGGTGQSDNPYLISTADDLDDIRNNTDDYYSYFVLTNDIDMAGYSYSIAVIPYSGLSFAGSFDGQGFVIGNLTITGSNDYVGLFGSTYAAEIKNVGIVDCDITGYQMVGALAGVNGGSITNCYSTGQVNGYRQVAGLIGYNGEGIVKNCYSSCEVNGTMDYVGGLVGYNWYGNIASSFSTGSSSGRLNTGGLLGDNMQGSVNNCYAAGAVTGLVNIGGLVGFNDGGSIANCYSTGLISASAYFGGLCGYQYESSASIEDCFWDVNTSGTTTGYYLEPSSPGTVTKVVGMTTVDMKNESKYMSAGWDFVVEVDNGLTDIWFMPDSDYPKLWWQYDLQADTNFDGTVSLADFSKLTEEYLLRDGDIEQYRLKSDFNQNQVVDFTDVISLAADWLEE